MMKTDYDPSKRFVKDAQGRTIDTHPKVKAAQERYYKETHRKRAQEDQQK